MKNVITLTAAAIITSFAAPAFADISDVQARFALDNDSAAERIVRDTNIGDTARTQLEIALYNDSAAERNPIVGGTFATRGNNAEAQKFFALTNDSAAERITK